jgi:hypothetical protein
MALQRAIGVGLLPAGGRLHHVVTHETEQLVDLDIGYRDALHDGDREGTVVALAVERGLSVLGRIHHERRSRHLDLAEAAADRTGADGAARRRGLRRHRVRRRGAAHLRRGRIVAAGVEQDQLELLRAFDRHHHLFERHRLELHVAVGGELGVHRDEIVHPVHLDAVAGVVDHRPIGLLSLVREGAQRIDQLLARGVAGERHCLETDGAQR